MPRVLERFPGHFEQEPLLRVHAGCLARRDPEELRVEQIHAIEESAEPRGHPPGRLGIGREVGVRVPSIGGYFTDGVAAVAQKRPERLGAVRVTREPASHPDDGDRLGAFAFERVHARLEIERQQGETLGRQLRNAVQEFVHRLTLSMRWANSRSTSSSDSCSMPVTESVGATIWAEPELTGAASAVANPSSLARKLASACAVG